MLTDTDNQNLQSNYPVERFSIKVINTRVINTDQMKFDRSVFIVDQLNVQIS